MRKRTITIIIILVLAIGAFAAYSFTKKPEPKYTTVKVVRGEILQTVSATGTVEAETKLDLRFVNSGKINQINVKVGDHIESGSVLAMLDTVQLESQLNKANASLNAAKANLSKLFAGATPEDIRVSQTAVENAQISLDSAEQNLLDVQASASKDITSSQASIDSAQVVLDNANSSLDNTIISNENNLNQDYDSAWNTVNSSLITVSNSLDTNKTTLEYDDAQDTLSVLNLQYLNDSSQSKAIASNSYNNTKNYVDSVESNLSHEETDQSLDKVKITLEYARHTLEDTSNILQATITSSKLSQTELDTLKSNISIARANITVAISNITASEQNISSQEITNQTNFDSAQATVNSASSSLEAAKQSLAAIQASSDSKINTAQNAVKSAEGALKQAQDQLAFKKAGPSRSEISLYKAQVQEAEASVNLIQAQINDSILIAPRGGVVTEINGEEGETITSAENFISLITSENFEIKTNVSEVDIAKIKIDDGVDITFDALGTDSKFKGTVIKIDPAETEISGVIYYKVTTIFTGNAGIVKSGMTANLDILTARKDDVIRIPFQALKEKDGQRYVQVLENKKAKDIFIEVGLRGDVNIEVLKGLNEGQKVITFVEE